jgi:CheY-like chemotaxis protein
LSSHSAPELLIPASDVSLAPPLATRGRGGRRWRRGWEGDYVRVLVVDDDAGIRDILRALLEEEGYTVAVAADGEAGLRAILSSAGPLIVLLDLLLPGLSGEETLAAALEYQRSDTARPRTAFIIISAIWTQFNTPSLLELTREFNIPILRKPFDTDRLLSAIASAAAKVA